MRAWRDGWVRSNHAPALPGRGVRELTAVRGRASQADDEREPEFAALLIQQCYRGFASRKKTDAMRAEELIFIGMAPPPPKLKEEDPLLKEAEVKKRARGPWHAFGGRGGG